MPKQLMTNRELIELLQARDPDAVAVIHSPGGYKPIDGVWSGAYCHDTGIGGLRELTEQDREQGYTEEDIVDGPTAVFVYARYGPEEDDEETNPQK